MKKILILGAGNAQIDAIEYLCEIEGLEVHVCSWSASDKGAKRARIFEEINIADVEKVCEYAQKEKIDYVYSIGSDLAMPTVAEVSARLGLPCFMSPELPIICNNKHLLRNALGEDFDGNIKFVVAETMSELEEWKHFPCVMKPVDSQGQRGVFEVWSAEDLKRHFDVSLHFSAARKVIVEEYADGQEFSVNCFFCQGEMVFSLISDRIVFDEFPGGIIKKHHLPTLANFECQTLIMDLVRRSAERLNIKDGPVYYQIKLSNGAPKIIEITPRLDGCHMWKLIKRYCGDDLLAASFEYLLYDRRPVFKCEFPTDKYSLDFMCEKPYEIFRRSKHDVGDSLDLVWYYQDGDKVASLNGHMEKCGYVIREVAK